MSIMILLAALVVPAFNTIQKGSQLTQAGQMTSDQLGMARQAALSKNHSVEVRIYQYSDPSVPGETAGNASAGKYRAIQFFEMVPGTTTSGSSTTTYTALTNAQPLPSTMIMDAGATLSNIIGNAQAAPAVPASTTGSALNLSIPRAGTAYNACLFHFLPDGSTDLPTTLPAASPGMWFLTMHDLNNGDNLTVPPKNFSTVQIDPYNGHIKAFRP
jgi:uncharacterized protein (TIGR02596 family)